MTKRHMSCLFTFVCAACGYAGSTLSNGDPVLSAADTVTMSGVPGQLIARDSLIAVDGNVLPCCSTDSAGVRMQITAGTLNFYAATSYAESAITPAGPRPRACVQEVPNGSHLALNQLLTLPSGDNYLLLPCSAGLYAVTLTQRLDFADGSSASRPVTLSSGRYGWEPRTLSMREQGVPSGATAAMSGAVVTVSTPGRSYQFLAVRLP